MVKNTKEWLESREKLKERKKRKTRDGRVNDESAASGFPMGFSRSRLSGSKTPPAARGETHER